MFIPTHLVRMEAGAEMMDIVMSAVGADILILILILILIQVCTSLLYLISDAMRTRCFCYFRKTGSPSHNVSVLIKIKKV